MTGNQRQAESRVIRSSAIPSEKYSWSASPLRLSNDSTAMAGRPENPGTVSPTATSWSWETCTR
jgi:hypothetical protein